MAQGESRWLPLRHAAVALPSEEPGCRVAHSCRPQSTAGGLYPGGNPGAGAWEPLECRPLVVTASVVSLPLFSRCSFQSVDLVFIDPTPGPTSWQNLLLSLF